MISSAFSLLNLVARSGSRTNVISSSTCIHAATCADFDIAVYKAILALLAPSRKPLIFLLYHACQMETLRKYWFMVFLASVLVAYIAGWIVPAWEKEITRLVGVAFVGLVAWVLFDKLDRIEGKLDAILKKLNER